MRNLRATILATTSLSPMIVRPDPPNQRKPKGRNLAKYVKAKEELDAVMASDPNAKGFLGRYTKAIRKVRKAAKHG